MIIASQSPDEENENVLTFKAKKWDLMGKS